MNNLRIHNNKAFIKFNKSLYSLNSITKALTDYEKDFSNSLQFDFLAKKGGYFRIQLTPKKRFSRQKIYSFCRSVLKNEHCSSNK